MGELQMLAYFTRSDASSEFASVAERDANRRVRTCHARIRRGLSRFLWQDATKWDCPLGPAISRVTRRRVVPHSVVKRLSGDMRDDHRHRHH